MWTTLALMVLAAGVVHALTEAEIADLLEQYNLLAVRHCTSSNLAAWNVDTNRHDPGRYEEIQVRELFCCCCGLLIVAKCVIYLRTQNVYDYIIAI